jgi:hypothetical protein
MTWDAAVQHCATLSYGAHSDWRLPLVTELMSLVRGCPNIGTCAITEQCETTRCDINTCNDCAYYAGPSNRCYWPSEMKGDCSSYWSATNTYTTTRAYYVVFYLGNVYEYLKSDEFPARCVR